MPTYDLSQYIDPSKKETAPQPVEPVTLSDSVNSDGRKPADLSPYIDPVEQPGPNRDIHRVTYDTTTPETEARIAQLSMRTRLPESIIRRDVRTVERYDEFQRMKGAVADAPKTARFLSIAENMAAVRGDVEALAKVEKSMTLGDFGRITAAQAEAGLGDMARGNEGAYMRYDPDKREDVRGFQLAIKGMNDAPTYWMKVKEHLDAGDTQEAAESAALIDLQQEIAKGYWGELAKSHALPEEYQKSFGLLGDAWFGLVRSAPAMAANVLGGIAGFGAVYQQIYGAKYDELVQAGVNEHDAALGARAAAAYSAPLEHLGNILQLKGLFKGLAGKKAGEFLLGLAESAGGEGLEEYTQQFADEWGNLVAANPDATGEELFNEFMSRFGSIATSSESGYAAATGAVGGLMLPLGGRALRVPVDLAKYKFKKAQTEAFTDQQQRVDRAVQATKTAGQNPVMMEKFLNDNLGLKDQDAYVEGEAILELAQTAPELLDEVVEQMQADKQDVLDAANQGRAVRMNLGAFHARLSPEAKSALFPTLKASPGAYSVRQVQEGLTQAEADFEDRYSLFAEENSAIEQEMQRIRQEAVSQGADPKVAEQAARIAGRMAVAHSERVVDGKAVDLLKKINIGAWTVQGEDGLYQNGISVEAERKLDEDALTFSEQVDEMTGGRLFSKPIRMMHTPLVLQLAGADNIPLVVRQRTLNKIISGKHQGDMTADLVKQLPRALADPILILKDKNDPTGTFVAVVELRDTKGAAINVPVALHQKGQSFEVNRVKSVFGRQWPSGKPNDLWYSDALKQGRGLYVDTKRAPEFLTSGQAVPIGEIIRGNKNILTEADLVKIREENPTLYQLKNGRKGAVRMFDDRYLISLFESADASTPFHELGHVFTLEMEAAVKQDTATEQMRNDFRTLLEWAGVESADQLTREHYEQFARGFEAYLMEGKAPTPELIPAFKRFRRWLKAVYEHVKHLGVNLTDEVREVYDRMILAERQIENAVQEAGLAPLSVKEMDEMGILAEDQEYLTKLAADAQEEAEIALERARRQGVKQHLPQWKKEAQRASDSNLMHDLARKFKKGRGIDRDLAVSLWGAEVIDRMPKGLKTVFKKGGMNPDEAAYESGFDSAEQLFDAFENYVNEQEEQRAYIKQKKQEFEASLLPEDFLFDTDQYAEYLGILGNYTAGKMTGSATKAQARSAFRKYAKGVIRSMALRDATRTDLFINAVKKAATTEKAAIKRGDWAAAQRANEQMRLNFEMAQESRRVREDRAKAERLAKRLKKADPSKIKNDFLGAALKLIRRFGLADMSDANTRIIDKAGDIRMLLASGADEMGPSDFGFSRELLEGESFVDYRDLSPDELHEVYVLLKALSKLGHDAINPMLTSLGKTLDEVRPEVLDAVGQLTDKKIWTSKGRSFFGMNPAKWFSRKMAWLEKHTAESYHLWAMIRVLDGFTYYTDGEPGPFERYFRDNLEAAYALKQKLVTTHGKRYNDAVRALFARSQRKELPLWIDTGVEVPYTLTRRGDKGFDFQAVVAVALNMGNESNFLRLKEGYGWSDEQVNRIVSVLNDEEWAAIQEIWDTFEAMRPEFFATSERINGVEPPRVEPKAFTTPTGVTLRGGYVPAVYDQGNVRAAEMSEKELLRESANSGHSRAAVNSRATKARASSGGGMPIKLDLSGVTRQMDYNMQYIAFAEAIRDLSRVMNNQEIVQAIEQKTGAYWIPAMRQILSAVASSNRQGNATAAVRLFQQFAAMTTKYILGGNRSVGAKQGFSLPAVYVEGGAWAKGLKYIVNNPVAAWEEMVEASPNMQARMTGRSIDRDVQKARRQLDARSKLAGVPGEIVDAVLFMYIRAVDAMTVLPAWHGTRINMEQKYGLGERAIRETDKVIFDTQPISREMDQSVLQLDKTSLSRLMTFFSGFTMKFENRKRVYVKGFLEGKIPLKQFMWHVAMERVLPPMLMNMLFTLGAGDDPEPDDMLWDILLYQVCGFPFIREAALLGANAARAMYKEDFRPYAAFGSPISTVFESIEWNVNSLAKWMSGEADDREAALAAIDLLFATKGVPAVRMYKDFQESARQFEYSDGFDAWFKLIVKPDPKEKE